MTNNEPRWQATADRVELAELMHRYALAIDTAQFDDLRDVFTADASVDFGSVDQYVEARPASRASTRSSTGSAPC